MMSMIETEIKVNCHVCARQYVEDLEQSVNYVTDNAEFSKVQKPERISFCPYCSVGIAVPQLPDDAIDSLYSDGDYWRDRVVRVFLPRNYPGQYAMAKARWQFIEEYLKNQKSCGIKNISMLDIGGGHGFIGMVTHKSRQVKLEEFCIIEMDMFFVESSKLTWSKNYPNVKFNIHDSLDKCAPGQLFDIIILSHILEHLNDPKAIVVAAVEKLRPGGLVMIDVPYKDFLFKKDVFPHIHFFNQVSMERILEGTGLKVERLKHIGRHRQNTPLNYRGANRFTALMEKIFYKFRALIPACISSRFFIWYLGASREDPEGTWLRILARNL